MRAVWNNAPGRVCITNCRGNWRAQRTATQVSFSLSPSSSLRIFRNPVAKITRSTSSVLSPSEFNPVSVSSLMTVVLESDLSINNHLTSSDVCKGEQGQETSRWSKSDCMELTKVVSSTAAIRERRETSSIRFIRHLGV